MSYHNKAWRRLGVCSKTFNNCAPTITLGRSGAAPRGGTLSSRAAGESLTAVDLLFLILSGCLLVVSLFYPFLDINMLCWFFGSAQARECWICRDLGTEPLIHPCGCRGPAWRVRSHAFVLCSLELDFEICNPDKGLSLFT